jgi:hypothetical protein
MSKTPDREGTLRAGYILAYGLFTVQAAIAAAIMTNQPAGGVHWAATWLTPLAAAGVLGAMVGGAAEMYMAQDKIKGMQSMASRVIFNVSCGIAVAPYAIKQIWTSPGPEEAMFAGFILGLSAPYMAKVLQKFGMAQIDNRVPLSIKKPDTAEDQPAHPESE